MTPSSMKQSFKLEHVGIAVTDRDRATEILNRLLGCVPYKSEEVVREGVETVFFDAGGSKFEILASTDRDSPVDKFITRRGEGLHHIAVEVADIAAAFDRVTAEGFSILSAEPQRGADGKLIFFVHPKETFGTLIEFCQQTAPTWVPHDVHMPHGVVRAFTAGSPDAPPILLLHDQGAPGASSFQQLLPLVEPTMFVIAFDAPGHGASTDWPSGTSILKACDKHARAILNHFRVATGAIIVGNGLGCTAAVQCLSSYPELVAGLALVDAGDHPIDLAALERCARPVLIADLESPLAPDDAAALLARPSIRHVSLPDVLSAWIHVGRLIADMVYWDKDR